MSAIFEMEAKMANQLDTVCFFIGLLCLVAFLYGPWQKLWIDYARQRMFEARDSVFDIAAGGGISFSDEKYIIIRSGIENVIRFSHKITWPRLLIYHFVMAREIEYFRDKPDSMLASIDAIQNAQVKDSIHKQYRKVKRASALLLLLRSPMLLVAMLVLVIPAAVILMFAKKIGQWVFQEIVREAERCDIFNNSARPIRA
ncbi:MAG: hypothetical protein WCF85_12745 [Rhodospirillaceae bacterium]